MNNLYKLILVGLLIGAASFWGYRSYFNKKITSEEKNQIKIINNNVDLGIYKIISPKHVFFKIVNNNKHTLKIEKIIPDCDCYSITANKKEITPGDTLVVETKYDAYPGPFLKKINVYFKNDKNPLILFFKGKVISG